MHNLYQWLNKEKSRYYTIVVSEIKRNEIMINYYWGAWHSNRGGNKNILVKSQEEATCYINSMMKRRKSRGYQLIASR